MSPCIKRSWNPQHDVSLLWKRPVPRSLSYRRETRHCCHVLICFAAIVSISDRDSCTRKKLANAYIDSVQEVQKVIDGEPHDDDVQSRRVLQDDLDAAHREVSLAEVSH